MRNTATSTVPLGSPLYAQVKQAMLAALASGEWKQGDAVPPEKTLAERFGVSIGTLRKAIDELAAENILVRHQGRGTYVAVHTRNHHFFKFFRIVRQDGHKSYPATQLLRFRRARATALVRERLGLPTGAYVFEFSNVLSLNGDVVMVDDICLPESRFPGMTEGHLRERPSTLYALYQDAFGVNVIATDERLRVCLADATHAEWLGVAEHTPLLEIRRVAYSYNRQAVEWRVSRVNTAAYEYLGQEPGAALTT
ncbi:MULTISPECIES: GntR family transcriptional regulator [Bordetella]|uniref:GntR family transcriptional regulator n=2 Tax=Bordetella TaxID=517 RepID=A0A261W9M8_9BORD|nr:MULTISPECIES: GntR family transcriptional regulator [Bordetella]MDM9558235.1 GntR family transcriptional regulator [Bordetella petrii]OZI82700.1 GntR family transcriptional regulator [Bordetella genomosp. 2]